MSWPKAEDMIPDEDKRRMMNAVEREVAKEDAYFDAVISLKILAQCVLAITKKYTGSYPEGLVVSDFKEPTTQTGPDKSVPDKPVSPSESKYVEGKFTAITGTLLDDPVQKDIDTTGGPKTVTNFRLSDGEEEVRMAIWTPFADEAMDLVNGDVVTFTNMKVGKVFDGLVQIGNTKNTKITKSSAEKTELPKNEPVQKQFEGTFKKLNTEAVVHIAMEIAKAKPNLTPEVIIKLVEEERAKAAGLLTEEAAAYLVASNLGVDIIIPGQKGSSPPSGELPDNVTEENVVEFYKSEMANLVDRENKPLEDEYLKALDFELTDTVVNMKLGKFIPDPDGRRVWAVLNNGVKQFGGVWVKEGKNSRWELPLPA